MFRLTKKLVFAIEAVLDIAYNTFDTPVQSAEITERQGIPRRYLEQVLQQLVRAGILSGVRGPRGGYKLARERRRISIGDIVRVVRSVEGVGDPMEADAGSRLGREIVRPMWQGMMDDCMAKLDEITIDDLCRQAQQRSIAREGVAGADWTI
ncbi:MAG: Rrf2 family transcriptional regulator [Azospirillaceae bacterium]